MSRENDVLQGIEHHGKGRYDKAEIFFRKAITSDPKNLSAYNNLALSLAEKGNKKEAVRILKKAIKMCEHDRGFYTTLKKNMVNITSGRKSAKSQE